MSTTTTFIFSVQLLLILGSFTTGKPTGEAAPKPAPTVDRTGLLSFKSHITTAKENAYIFTSWNDSTETCNWFGVSCEAPLHPDRVTSLALPSLDIAGTISPSLSNLSLIREINLGFNSLHGEIPPEIANLRRLRTLNLTSNSLQGEIPGALFTDLPELQLLTLRGNQLHGMIPRNLTGGTKLKKLILRDNNLTGGIPPELDSLQNLELLGLNNNNLIGEIPPSIGNITNLVELNLSHNNLVGGIPSQISSCTNLKVLDLMYNRLSGQIPPSLFNFSSLFRFSVGANLLTGTLPSDLGQNLPQLRHLYLHENKFSGRIPPSLSDVPKLEYIGLEDNGFTGEIPPSIGNITTLIKLHLSKNNLVGGIPSQISSCINLKYLLLMSNRLSGQIPTALFNFSSLFKFSVGYNLLTGTLPSDFGRNLPQLRYLYLYGNKFSGRIPRTLSDAPKLEHIDLGDNSYTGSIPSNLGSRLPNLSNLILSNNLLSTDDWSFIDSLTNCSYLKVLELWNNSFTGFLPESITKLSAKTLIWLALGDNKIMGEIPVMIGELSSLVTLGMGNNHFTGSIPESIGKLRNLKIFDINENKLSGTIPDSFGNLTEMLELYMSRNELTGTIPSNFAAMDKLIVLDLSHNNLTGVVPKGLLGIPTIAIFLNISHNNLVGVLPDEVGSLMNLQSFDASYNGFHGRIPESIGSCLLLESLMLQGNEFNGAIPNRLQNLKGLNLLDLSENHLSGPIPSYLEKMTLLQYLNLSYNDLEGKVPTQGVFSNADLFSIEGNEKLFTHHHHHRELSKRNLVAIVVVIAVLCFIGVFLLYKYKVSPETKDTRRNNMEPRSVSWGENQFFKISYAEIQKATRDFSPANLIGSGGFGSVYRGMVTINVPDSNHSTVDIAVKVLSENHRAISKSFMTECNVLRSVRHRNLVRVLTACSSEDLNGNEFKALVYEYMPNGSLDKWLKKGEEPHDDGMSLLQRLNIAIDVASALDYLHTQIETAIVHCDLKPSNILLDVNFVACVSDFGIAKFLSTDRDETLTTAIQGSIGYIAPECGTGSRLSTLWDVYSYGILVLEIFTCKSPTSKAVGDGMTLHQHVETSFPYEIMKIVDPFLLQQDEGGLEERRIYDTLVSIMKIGLICSLDSPNERMQMKDVIRQLCDIRDDIYNQMW